MVCDIKFLDSTVLTEHQKYYAVALRRYHKAKLWNTEDYIVYLLLLFLYFTCVRLYINIKFSTIENMKEFFYNVAYNFKNTGCISSRRLLHLMTKWNLFTKQVVRNCYLQTHYRVLPKCVSLPQLCLFFGICYVLFVLKSSLEVISFPYL